jgi:hypothetical protein
MARHVLAAAMVVLLPFASAKCYKDSPAMSSQQFALDNLSTVATMLSGSLVGGQIRGICATDKANSNNWYFSVRNTGKNTEILSLERIRDHMIIEITACGNHGGYKKDHWIEMK